MSHSVFASMVDDLERSTVIDRTHFVSHDQYHEWKRSFVFEALKGARYGQSFCNKFDIHDNILFYTRDWRYADYQIRTTYLEKIQSNDTDCVDERLANSGH